MSDFKGQNESKYLDWKGASVDVVSQEEILSWLDWASSIRIDYFNKIVELAMNISDDGHRVLNFD